MTATYIAATPKDSQLRKVDQMPLRDMPQRDLLSVLADLQVACQLSPERKAVRHHGIRRGPCSATRKTTAVDDPMAGGRCRVCRCGAR